ncbi:uncharacterized protein LOC126843522 isoform X2 [Adelges cooleyi]|uniref:uncharacterized protein LOC126843522 isoform X2 n=1 Tax=Adelges cooleyi TaxID=133065 RepID=UPI00217FCC64|nr:uncharacterized protein LOC126843522 isoform X2 [Adelges cooleyi]
MNAKYLTIICLIFIHCQTAKSNDPPEKDRKGKSIVVSTSAQEDKPKEIEALLGTVEQKQEAIWKIVEIKQEGQTESYTTTDDLIIVLPDQTKKIIDWLCENQGSDEEFGTFIIKKPRFKALLQSLATKKRKKDLGLCSISTQDWSYLDKPIEIEKLWKILELKDIVESKEKRLGFTTRTEVIKALPVHTVGAVFQWIEKNAEGNESGSFQITKEEFKDLVQSIPLDLETLKALNKHLEENPSTFVD